MDYVVKRGVPILDEHILKDDEGEILARIDAKKLKVIANKANRRVRETGDEVPIIIGHTVDDAPEDQQPEIVGYASNFSVGPLKRTGRQAIKATFKFFKDKVAKVRNYPRRSVELWLSDWKIDPIALLGATTPERDLGLLRLSRDGKRKYRRVFEDTMPDEVKTPPDTQSPEEKVVSAVVKALQETDVWKWAEQQMRAQEGDVPESPDVAHDDLDGVPGDGDFDEDDLDLFDGDDDDFEEDEPEEEPMKYQNASPSGTNTGTPGAVETDDRRRMSRDQKRGLLARYARERDFLLDQVEGMRRKFQRVERERDLIQLESEGYILDRVEELDYVEGMPEAVYKKHLNTVRKRYQRAPVGRLDIGADAIRSAPAGAAGRDRDRVSQIVEYAQRKGISYADALEELEGEPVL